MPTFVKGNMWDVFGNTDLFLITTNPIQRQDGAVVMGRGIAKQMKDRFPEFPYDFGQYLQNLKSYVSALPPRVGVVGRYDDQLVGYFMVKDHWRDVALPNVIAESTKHLQDIAANYQRVDLNFPGIGNGRLKREDVIPLLDPLPSNVHVWEYGA